MKLSRLLYMADRMCMGRLVFSQRDNGWVARSAVYAIETWGRTGTEALALLIDTAQTGGQ